MQHGGADETPVAGGTSPPALDWGAGHYESTAEQILPAARAVVAAAAIGTDERVLDLGCGTGNAALLAAEHTGQVTGVDPAPRLLQVARARAAGDGKKAEFLPGNAASLPAGDANVDVILKLQSRAWHVSSVRSAAIEVVAGVIGGGDGSSPSPGSPADRPEP